MENDKALIKKDSMGQIILKALLISYVLTFVVFIIYAILITYTGVSEKGVDTVALVTAGIAVLLAGFEVGIRARAKGLIFGMLTGVLYCLIMLLIGFTCFGGVEPDTGKLLLVIISALGGGVGGIIGINGKN